MSDTYRGRYQLLRLTPEALSVTYFEDHFDKDAEIVHRTRLRTETWEWEEIRALRWNPYFRGAVELRIEAVPEAVESPRSDGRPRIGRVCVEANLSRKQWRRFARRVAELTAGRLVVEPAVPPRPRPWWRGPR